MKKFGLILFMVFTVFLFSAVKSYTSYESERTEINRAIGVADSTNALAVIDSARISTNTSNISANTANIASETSYDDSLYDFLKDGILQDGNLAITTPAEDFKIAQAPIFDIGGIQYTRQALDSISFSSAYTVNTGADSTAFWGIFLVQVNASGTISTKAPGADQVYADSLTAISNLPAPDASNVSLGYILIENNIGSAWTANTDDMTPASDCNNSVFQDTSVKVLPTER